MKNNGCKLKRKTNLLKKRICKFVQCLILGVVLSSLLFSMIQEEYMYINRSIPKASTIHSPISINGNGALDAFCAGNGTDGLSWDTAHVIEGFEIDAGGIGSGIYIRNTDRFLIIRNSNIINSGLKDYRPVYVDSGIALGNVKNIKISKCNLNDNHHGLSLYNMNNCNIWNNNASYNLFSISVCNGTNNTISGNDFSHNEWCSFMSWNSHSNDISDNDISYNKRYGVYLIDTCNYNTISGNNVSYNELGGIKLLNSSGNTITGNNASYNTNFGISLGPTSNNNEVYQNIVCFNDDEDILDYGENNDIRRNDHCSGIPSYPIAWVSVITLCSIVVSIYVVRKKYKK